MGKEGTTPPPTKAPNSLPPTHRVQLGHVHLPPVVEERVESLQHGLRRQIELVQEHPVARPQRRQQRAVRPRKLARRAARRRQVGAQQVHHVGLFGEVDAHEGVAGCAREGGDKRGFANPGGALQQDGFWEGQGAQEAHRVAARGGGVERECAAAAGGGALVGGVKEGGMTWRKKQ